ncbi:MAG: molybdopterin molybdotransferase MoeA [Nitrososphaerota archaeon]|jgi:molybdenum cofactor synthesis domain-containing protein|nr:molybdopterin molybdotransferase MoeA [Nitrososphaerota archaeon]
MSVNEALKNLFVSYSEHSHFTPKIESTNLHGATNRVLAQNFISPIDIPPFDKSAMDGYAVIAANTKGASKKNPISLEVIATASAGDDTPYKISPGQAVAIATGARIPQDADAVVMVEDTDGDKKTVKIFKEIKSNKNIIVKGEDIKAGELLLKRGTWLRPQNIGLIASVGTPSVKVFCKLKVAIFSTGSELIEPGSELSTNAILYDSNRYMLSGMIHECGGEAVDLGICRDDPKSIQGTLKKALQYDLVVISGGSSVGEKDYVPAVINNAGNPGIIVHGIAMRPGSPTALGIVDGKPIILTPGYPVASFFAFYTFGRPLILTMLETKGLPQAKIIAKMASSIKLREGMQAFVRVKLTATTDPKGISCYMAEPVSATAASLLSTLTGPDGVVIANGKSSLIKGQKVEVLLLRAGSV